MLRVWAILCSFTALSAGSTPSTPVDPSPRQILARVRENVFGQLKQATNYTCTEVLDRSYFFEVEGRDASCGAHGTSAYRRPYMHDRLRLDVAVSSTGEIFSWHGGKEFSTAGIKAVVKTGAISSGAFIGYLHNIFGRPGVIINYAGPAPEASEPTALFNYAVPLASSNQQVEARHAQVAVPFHGSFTVPLRTLQLASLEVVIDHGPPRSEICSASMTINYQMVQISGQLSLIPRTYVMNLDLVGDQSNTSRTDFTECRAFRGESVMHYADVDDAGTTKSPTGPELFLPERIKLHALLTTRIDDAASFTGDPVEATLLKSVTVPGTNWRLQKGSRLKGIITRLEFYYLPVPHYRLAIHLDSLTDGPKTYRMNALLQTPYSSRSTLMDIYGSGYRERAVTDSAGGEFVFLGRSFHTTRDTGGTWITSRTGGE